MDFLKLPSTIGVCVCGRGLTGFPITFSDACVGTRRGVRIKRAWSRRDSNRRPLTRETRPGSSTPQPLLTLVYRTYFLATKGVTEGGGYLPLDFRYKASDSYDFGTRGQVSSFHWYHKSTSTLLFDVTMTFNDVRVLKSGFYRFSLKYDDF